MVNYDELSKIDFLPEMSGAPLAAKADVLHRFCRDYTFAPSGLAYSMPLIIGKSEARPLSNADLIGTASYCSGEYTKDEELKDAIANEGCTFENSLCTSGLYLQAHTWRYLVTGEENARQEARRGFEGIRLVYEMNAAAGRAGFLAKPYGERASLVSTADQYLFALCGLYQYQKIADPEDAALIDRIFTDCAEFAMACNYEFSFLKSDWYLKCEWNRQLEEKGYVATMQSEKHAYNAIHILLQVLGWKASGNERYREESERLREHGCWLTETYLDTWRDLGMQYLLMFERVGLAHYAIAAGEVIFEIAPDIFGSSGVEQAKAWQTAARRWWDFGRLGMDDDFLTHYWTQLDVPSGMGKPTGFQVKEGLVPSTMDDFYSGDYLSDVCHSELAYRVCYNSLALALCCPDEAIAARALAIEILQRTDGKRLRWMIDPDGQQLVAPFRYMTALLSSETPGLFLTTYWKGRWNRLWD